MGPEMRRFLRLKRALLLPVVAFDVCERLERMLRGLAGAG